MEVIYRNTILFTVIMFVVFQKRCQITCSAPKGHGGRSRGHERSQSKGRWILKILKTKTLLLYCHTLFILLLLLLIIQVIAAEGEQKASRSLRDAATIISESPAALQLRYLQTLNSVA